MVYYTDLAFTHGIMAKDIQFYEPWQITWQGNLLIRKH